MAHEYEGIRMGKAVIKLRDRTTEEFQPESGILYMSFRLYLRSRQVRKNGKPGSGQDPVEIQLGAWWRITTGTEDVLRLLNQGCTLLKLRVEVSLGQ